MKKFSGVTSFIGSIFSIVFLIYIFFEKEVYDNNALGVLTWALLITVCVSVVYYTLATNFGASKNSAIESLERENEIIRKQIEKRELLLKLERLEKKA